MQTDSDVPIDRHIKLTRIAGIADAFMWIVLMVFVFAALGRWMSLNNEFNYQIAMEMGVRSFKELRNNPLYIITVAAEVLSVFFNGVVFALVLKTVSLSIYMIVETDLNYRAEEEPKGTS